MTYSLDFDARALKEWKKLGDTVRQQFKKKTGRGPAEPSNRGKPPSLAAGLLQDKASQQWVQAGLSGH